MGAWQERGRGSSGPHMTRPDPELACVARPGSSREAAQHSQQHPHLSQSHSLAAVVTSWSRSQAGHSSVSTDDGVEGGVVEAGWVVAQCTAAASLPCQPSPHHAWRLS